MNFPFNSRQGLIEVDAIVQGPGGSVALRLGLDTGATTSVISAAALLWLGYDLATASQHVQMTTASGIDFVPIMPIIEMTALGQTRRAFPVLAHTLPPGIGVDGLLGLDFLRSLVVTLDFPHGQITVV